MFKLTKSQEVIKDHAGGYQEFSEKLGEWNWKVVPSTWGFKGNVLFLFKAGKWCFHLFLIFEKYIYA